MIEFRLPSLGSDMDSGKLLQWQVAVGDTVRRGQVVAVVDTAKAAIDVECWQPGVVAALLVEPPADVPVGAPLMLLREPAETDEDVRGWLARRGPAGMAAEAAAVALGGQPARAAPARAAPAGLASASPAPASLASASPAPASPAPLPASARRPVAAPIVAAVAPRTGLHAATELARSRARELRVDLGLLHGSGPQGQITVADVEAAAEAAVGAPMQAGEAGAAGGAPMPQAMAAATGSPAAPATTSATTSTTPPAPPSDRAQEMRRVIAAAMARSKREIPHYYLREEIDFEQADAWIKARNASLPLASRLLPAALLVKAVAIALQDHPRLNGFWRDERFVPGTGIHVGVAVSLRGGGLVAPALRETASQDAASLTRSLLDLVKRTRAGSLRSSELADATITVTNLGDLGVDEVFGVIYPPQVALVGFGTIRKRPRVTADGVRGIPTVIASLSADHRVVDGHLGALFLARVAELLQEPQALNDAAIAAPVPSIIHQAAP